MVVTVGLRVTEADAVCSREGVTSDDDGDFVAERSFVSEWVFDAVAVGDTDVESLAVFSGVGEAENV